MKNEGKKFEEDFFNSLSNDFFKYRLRDAGGWSDATNTRFTPSNLCDLIYFNGATLYLMELKSVKGKSMPFSNIGNIKKLYKMVEEASKKDTIPCYIINFREVERTFYIQANVLKEFYETCGKKSINVEDCLEIADLIPQSKKISRYKYEF